MVDRDDYKFLEIRDAMSSLNQKVNLIGVVIEYGFPKKTKGTDCFCTIKIVDESCPKHGLAVNIFAEHFGVLPHVVAPGDIIQLSRVTMKTHGTEVFAVFNKRTSGFALYEGSGGEGFLPYQTSLKFRSREMDKKFLTGLRQWFMDFQIEEDSNNYSLLREAEDCKSISLVCKIIHVQEIGKDEWMAFVWDGTDMPPNKLTTRLEDEKENPIPLHLESLPLPKDTLVKFPLLGTVLGVVVFDQGIKKHGNQLLSINIGKWMKLINVYCEVHSGLWCGVLTPLTRVRYTLDGDRLVSERERLYNTRSCLSNGRMPSTIFPWMATITEVDHKAGTYLTLMDIITYPEVTAKFLCVVRVVASYPWLAKDFCSCRGVYRIRLTLEDPTARIHAYLYGEDAEKFFGGYPSVNILTRKRNALLGVATGDDGVEIEDAARNPPWIKCCIKSYYGDKNDIWGSRNYRIFDTKMFN